MVISAIVQTLYLMVRGVRCLSVRVSQRPCNIQFSHVKHGKDVVR